jgi:aspartate racemase
MISLDQTNSNFTIKTQQALEPSNMAFVLAIVASLPDNQVSALAAGPMSRTAPVKTLAKTNTGSHLVGVVGGIGPAASLRLQQLIFERDRRRCRSSGFLADASYTPFILYNNPQIPNNNLAALGIGPPSVDALVDSAVALRNGGADTVAFACTTAYTWQHEVADRAGVPVMKLLERVAQKVLLNGHRRVGLLDVDGTLAAGVFQETLERHGMEVVLPRRAEQKAIMEAVTDLKSGVNANDGPLSVLDKITDQLIERDGISGIVLGCTEIATAMGSVDHSNSSVQYFDTLGVLAEEIVMTSGHSVTCPWTQPNGLAENRYSTTVTQPLVLSQDIMSHLGNLVAQ